MLPVRSRTPLAFEYCPVMMLARLGVQIELLQNTRSNRMPPFASESMFGVGFSFASRLPYAPMACEVWSSDMINRTLGRSSAFSVETARTKAAKRSAFVVFILVEGISSRFRIDLPVFVQTPAVVGVVVPGRIQAQGARVPSVNQVFL